MKMELLFVLENAGWPALLVDGAGTICRANQAAVKLLGPTLEGPTPLLSAIWAPENGASAEQFLARWERSPVQTVSIAFRGRGGVTHNLLVFICAMTRDNQRFFVFQLLPEAAPSSHGPRPAAGDANVAQKQKLDCALQLARTVALDFNNALTSILGHTSLILSQMEPEHPWRASLIQVEKSAARAAEIANDLGTFSRQEKEIRPQQVGNLNLLLQRSVEFFQQNAGPVKPTWNLQLERKLFTSKFDEAKLQQALIKIIENAIQSLQADGCITIRTRNLELAESMQDRNVRLGPGAYVCVEIGDTGCGIESDVLPRVFEPFFTTKQGGQHRGLGLAWVYGIVTNHGGGVAISSQRGIGTSVRMYLPAEKRIVKDNGVPGDDLTGHETILIVDDEDLLLNMGQTILSAYGYRVLTANSGQRALDILARNESPIELVITDLVMPAMSGRELVERIHRISPAIRILCTSGYIWAANQVNNEAYLQKPFTSQELLVKVKQALARNAPG